MSEPGKVYIVLKAGLPPDSALNTAALLSMGLAKLEPGIVGPPVFDSSGLSFPGIPRVPVIIMKAKSQEKLKAVFADLTEHKLSPIPFFEHSRVLMTYREYEESLKQAELKDLVLSGFAVIGPPDVLKPWLKKFSLWK